MNFAGSATWKATEARRRRIGGLKVDDASRAEGFESSCGQFLEWNNSGAECGNNSPTAKLQCGEVRRLGKFLGCTVGKWHVQRMGKKVRDWYSEVGRQDIL